MSIGTDWREGATANGLGRGVRKGDERVFLHRKAHLALTSTCRRLGGESAGSVARWTPAPRPCGEVSGRPRVSRSALCTAPRPMSVARAFPASSKPSPEADHRLRRALGGLAQSGVPSAARLLLSATRYVPTSRGSVRTLSALGVAGVFAWGTVSSESSRPVTAAFAQIRDVSERLETASDSGASVLQPERSVARSGLAGEPIETPRLGRETRPAVVGRRPRLRSSSRRLLAVLPAGPFGYPVRGPVSSSFGMRVHPVTGGYRLHRGVDLAVPLGTPVASTAAGRVAFVGHRGGYGLAVMVDHPMVSGSVSTLYGHLTAVPSGLYVGQRIRRGTVVGLSGGVGQNAGVSTGPHVHYEIRTGGVAVDPAGTPRLVRARRSLRLGRSARLRALRIRSVTAARAGRRTASHVIP